MSKLIEDLRKAREELMVEQSLNQSCGRVQECELEVLKQENKILQEKLHLAHKHKPAGNHIRQMEEKYESLKRKFATVIKEKE